MTPLTELTVNGASIGNRSLRRGRALLGHELLDAPVDQLADPDFVLRRARDRVDPAELAEVPAGLSVDAEQLAFERHLVDAARIEIADEQDRIRSGRHAEGVR